MEAAIAKVEEKKSQRDKEREEEESQSDWFWNAGSVISSVKTNTPVSGRSIFSDVDE